MRLYRSRLEHLWIEDADRLKRARIAAVIQPRLAEERRKKRWAQAEATSDYLMSVANARLRVRRFNHRVGHGS